MPWQSPPASACQSLFTSLHSHKIFTLGSDTAVLNWLAGGSCTSDPSCTAASAAAEPPGSGCGVQQTVLSLMLASAKHRQPRRADVVLAHGWVFLSVVTNKHHSSGRDGSCTARRGWVMPCPLPLRGWGKPDSLCLPGNCSLSCQAWLKHCSHFYPQRGLYCICTE